MVMTHGLKNMYSLPSAIMRPHDGAGGGMPSPRNESVASSRIACAISKVATTTRALPIFGRISVRMMRDVEEPMARAAAI